MDKLQITKDSLVDKYVFQKKGIKQIAEEWGIGEVTVYNRLIAFGIETRGKGPVPKLTINKDELIDLYISQNKTLAEIGLILNCGHTTVKAKLIEFGIKRRKGVIRDSQIVANYLKIDKFHNVHRLRGALIWLYGNECQINGCGYIKFVDVHHLRGNGFRTKSGRGHTNNRISETVLLCPNHHREADNKLIPMETLEEIIKTRILKT